MILSRRLRTRAAAAVLGLGLVFAATPVAATDLPPGFEETILLKGLVAVTTIDFAPDGAIWLGGRLGDVWVWRGNQFVDAIRVPVDTRGEHGLVGLAVDPDYAFNNFVWVYYSTMGPPFRNRLSRFRNVGDQLVEETVVLETPDLDGTVHTGGCIRFADDKTIFLSTGDDLQGTRAAQSPFDLRGKILHIDRAGSPTQDNPFIDGVNGDPRVWALGFRNPWRFSIQPGSGNLFIGDVGGSRFEELNVGVPGGNFGWSEAEGPNPPGIVDFIYPIYSYPHTSPLGHAIIAGGHASAGNFPPDYQGDFFFADQVTREIYRMRLDAGNQVVSTELFASNTTGGAVELRFGPDGALYYIAHDEAALYRVSYAGGDIAYASGTNRQPVANASVSQDSGRAPLSVIFDASGSVDPDDDPLSFRWDFGDGTSSSERVVEKRYDAGIYSASLLVTDANGATSRVDRIRIVSGNERPSAVIQEPGADRRYHEGEIVVFTGLGIDPDGGLLPCEVFTWNVIFHHLGHTHPFLGPLEGVCGSRFQVDSHGEEQIFYEIRLTVKDDGSGLGPAGSLTGVHSVEVRPQ
jgi:glucose/arabinose dehydrogenase